MSPAVRRTFALILLLGACAAPVVAPPVEAPRPDRTAWLRRARWGVMTHFLADWRARDRDAAPSVEWWNALVDGFDVEALADQLASVGAGYHILSIGQNSGYYLAPNPEYDRLVGRSPSRCARRDLVADLARALDRRGIKAMVYLPSNAPGGDEAAVRALSFAHGPERNAEFQRRWEQVIAAWSRRWGRSVAGWWFDGCYWPNSMYRSSAPPNFASFAAAARAGNPDALVAFNPGVVYRPLSLTPEEDFVAGELDHIELWAPKRVVAGKADGAQLHVLSFLGRTWGRGEPRFGDEAVAFSRKVAGTSGVVTWDVPVEDRGTIPPAFLDQLRAIGAAVRGAGETTASPSGD